MAKPTNMPKGKRIQPNGLMTAAIEKARAEVGTAAQDKYEKQRRASRAWNPIDKKAADREEILFRFAREYIIDFSPMAAMKRTLESRGIENVPLMTCRRYAVDALTDPVVVKYIDDWRRKAMAEMGQELEVTADRVLKEFARIAFMDPRKLFDDQGNPVGITQLDDNTAAAVVGLDVVMIGNGDVGIGQVMKIKLGDKLRALENLGKHLGVLTNDVNINMQGSLAHTHAPAVSEEDLRNMSPEQLASLFRERVGQS